MHTVTIIRDHVLYGPYDEAHALAYFKEGKILLNDLTRIDRGMEEMSFGVAVERCGWKLPSQIKPWNVFLKMGFGSLLPFGKGRLRCLLKVPRTRLILIAGLVPLAALFFGVVGFTYFLFALYVSVLWGIFFWALFKTDTSSVKLGIRCFWVTAFISTSLLLILLSAGLLNLAEPLTESSSFATRFVGFFFRAGLPEEICKAAVIFWLVRRPGNVLKPQDVVLYGLLSGFGFGIHEGLLYQLGTNRELGNVDATYVFNILRLTSLPFLHACWCGIASYFIAYAAIVPMCRYGLWILAILIPAILHTAYDAAGGLIAFGAAALGVVLMLGYLEGAKSLRRKLM